MPKNITDFSVIFFVTLFFGKRQQPLKVFPQKKICNIDFVFCPKCPTSRSKKNQKTLKMNFINFRFFQNGSTIKFWTVYKGKSDYFFNLQNEERYANEILVVFQATDFVI